jgi:hypothetical protein
VASLEFAIEIAAPANLVSAFFVPQRMPYWYGAETESRFEMQRGASEFAAGQKVRITSHLRSREVTLTAVVTRYEYGRVLEWRFQDIYGVRGVQRWEIESLAAQPENTAARTRVRIRDQNEFPGRFGRLVDWLVTRHGVAQRDRRYLARQKKLTERR